MHPPDTPPATTGGATSTTLPVKTPIAADILGVTLYRLAGLVRVRKIPLPTKDSSGDFQWFAADIERARQALLIDHRLKAHRRPKGRVA